MKRILVLAIAGAMAAAGADVSGSWTGVVERADPSGGSTVQTPVEAELEQRESALSGKIGRSGDADKLAIKNGKVEGNRITFDVSAPERSADVRFALTVDGDRMQGEMRGTVDNGPVIGKVVFSRRK